MNDNLMTPSNAEPLQEFYDRKYSGSDVHAVQKAPLVHRPRNRLEMAAKVAASGAGGRYLEIAAGDGGLAAGGGTSGIPPRHQIWIWTDDPFEALAGDVFRGVPGLPQVTSHGK
jgi:hypothetical protein